MVTMKANKSRGFNVPQDATYYYKHVIASNKRVELEKVFIEKLKQKYKPKSKTGNNESFYISEVDDLEKIRDILVECALFMK